MKPFDSDVNADQYCRCDLTNSEYHDGNILVVWILLLVQTNVVVVFSATMLHLWDINFWSASIPKLVSYELLATSLPRLFLHFKLKVSTLYGLLLFPFQAFLTFSK